MDKESLSIYTVYDHPLDYPDSYVVRRWNVVGEDVVPDLKVLIVSKDLETIREMLVVQMGLTLIPRMLIDDSKILETYI